MYYNVAHALSLVNLLQKYHNCSIDVSKSFNSFKIEKFERDKLEMRKLNALNKVASKNLRL